MHLPTLLLYSSATSPYPSHFVLAFVVLVVWPLLVRLNRKSPALPEQERKRYGWIILGIMIVTIIGFSSLLVNAYTQKDIAGYQEYEQWEWMKTLHGQEAMYKGEWTAFLFLYIFPPAAAAVAYLTLPVYKHHNFLRIFTRLYPRIILCAYICFYLSAQCQKLDMNRVRTFPTEESE